MMCVTPYVVVNFIKLCVKISCGVQGVTNGDNFEIVGDCESSKQAWEILEKAYAGADKANVVRLQTHKRQLEFIKMEEKDTINDFTTRIVWLMNQVKSCRETVIQQYVVAKILGSLTQI